MKTQIIISLKISLIVSLVALLYETSTAQVSRSAYFYDNLPVANTLNPAFSPYGKLFISLPVISSTYIGFNSPVNYSEITEKGTADDYLYIDRQSILNNLDEVNVLAMNFYTTLGQVGIRSNRHAFQISLAKILSVDFTLEKEFVKFLLYGNASQEFIGRDLTFSKTALNSSLYHEFAFGYSFDLNNKITFGTKLKYLNGAANIYSENTTVQLFTQDDLSLAITAASDIAIHTSSTYGYLDKMGDQDMNQYLWLDLSNNHGFGLDLGVKYTPLPMLKLSLSVIDLGRIYWKENVKSYVSKNPGQPYTFNGIDLNDFIHDNTFVDTVPLLDSIQEHFKVEEVNEPYSSPLTPKSYLGVTYDLTPKDQFGLLIKTDYFQYLTRFCYTINYKRRFGKILSANINYSYTGKRSNLGFGLALKAGPVNIFALTDMMPSFFNTLNARAAYIQFGICLIFNE